jgi:aryl-alcohol dehydrogenase-like predicted oxidoreductase
MKYRKFGNTDLEVSEIGLGCSRLGGNLTGGSKREAFNVLQQALEQGINFYDTADSYGQGQSETLLGKVFKTQRDKVIFASKAGYCLSPLGSLAARFKPILKPILQTLRSASLRRSSSTQAHSRAAPQNHSGSQQKDFLSAARGNVLQQNFSPDYLQQALESSLNRLQTDYLDLFQLHSPPQEVLQSDEVWQTLEKLQSQGKIRYYGVSCDTVADALLCLQHPGVAAIQLELNLLNQDAIASILPLAQQQKIAIIARQPFASGKLFQLMRQQPQEKISEQWTQANIYRHLSQVSSRSPIQAALQFVLQQEGVSVVIAGASTRQHLAENLSALSAPPLSSTELQNLKAIASYF